MALLQSSGAISFSDIKGMYGGSTNVSIGDYIKSGSFVPTAPSSGNIPATKADMSLSKFYSTAKEYVITVGATTTNYNWQTAFAAAFPSPTRSTDYIARLIVNSGVTIGATATSSYALTVGAFPSAARLYIDNYGSIQGAGGAGASLADGSGLSGGPALNADVVPNTTITVKSGGSVYGGGGGGGKGGKGGTGGTGGGGSYVSRNEQYSTAFTNNYRVYVRYVTGFGESFDSSSWWWGGADPFQVIGSSGGNASSTPSGYAYGTFQGRTTATGAAYYSYSIVQLSTVYTSGGAGGAGGAGGNGGAGAGYGQNAATGAGGSTGSGGSAGGTNAGTGGTGGTGGSGGNGGGLGSAGFSGNSGNQGATGGGGGAAGASGASGTTAGSAGRSVFKNGRSTVTVTVESGGAILPGAA